MLLETWVLINKFIIGLVLIIELIFASDKEWDEDVIALAFWGEWDEETQRYYVDITDKWAIKNGYDEEGNYRLNSSPESEVQFQKILVEVYKKNMKKTYEEYWKDYNKMQAEILIMKENKKNKKKNALIEYKKLKYEYDYEYNNLKNVFKNRLKNK